MMIDNNCGKEKVWVPDNEKGWINGELLKQNEDGSYLVKDENGKELTIEKDELRIQNPNIQEGIDDMTSLSHLHEAAVIHNLIKRYELNSIYTYTGSILIAINPYTKLPIYSKEMIESFCDQPVSKLAPHVYSIAESSYREMLNFQRNQSILVSGESGAGKTETTKFLLQYFAAMGEKGNGVNTSMISEEEIIESNNIETQVIKSTPILEAFGNSKTLRNDNSSRFGKFIEIHFDKLKGTIVGAKLETYLLEKSRIVKPPENERGFHIFYQLLAGESIKQHHDQLKISSNSSDFNYLISSGCDTIEGVDDSQVFIKTEKALKVMGLSDDELLGIWRVLSAILHIGNIEFSKGEEEDSSKINESSSFGKSLFDNAAAGGSDSGQQLYNPLQVASDLLGCNLETLKSTFCSRKVKAGNESYMVNHTVEQACQARDSLSMFLYSRLFDWLVIRINESIDKLGISKKDYLFIGILDIYGFESFESNSFEQFTINYANEKLQNQFNHQIFKLEQQEYEKEKIDWSYIDFSDNQDCIDLIEKKPLGILSILDEESQFPKSTPTTLCTKLFSNHSKSKHFEKPRFSTTNFIIEHYAGKVDYDTNLFLEKNKDFIISEQVGALQSSSWEFIKNIFKVLSNKMNGTTASSGGGKSNTTTGGSSSKSTFKFTSVSSQFKESLNLLMATINSTNPHYIRCIKPNTEKRPNLFDNVMVLHQLRCSGVIEQLRISRSGYPSRLPYDNFIKRYKLIASGGSKLIKNKQNEKVKEEEEVKENNDEKLIEIIKSTKDISLLNIDDQRKGAEFLIDKLSIDIGSVQFGLTKLFFKSGIIANLELLRSQTMINSATFIQKIWRGFVDRKLYLTTLQSTIYFQSLTRMYLQQLTYNALLEENSAIHLQSIIRTNQLESEFNQIMDSTLHFQTLLRRLSDSKEFNEIMGRIKKITTIQSRWRAKQAYKEFKQLKLEAKSLTNVVAEKNKLVSRLGDIQSKLESESKLIQQIKNEKVQLSNTIENINLEKDQLISKLSNLQSEYDQYKKETELLINNLKNQLNDVNQPVTINNGDTTSYKSPPKSLSSSPIKESNSVFIPEQQEQPLYEEQLTESPPLQQVQLNSPPNEQEEIPEEIIEHKEEEEDSFKNISILSPKQHKGEHGRSDGNKKYQLSSPSPILQKQQQTNNSTVDNDGVAIDIDDYVPKDEYTQLEKEFNKLKQMDETHIKYIESLKSQITQLEDKVKKSSIHPRSLLPGIPSNINDSPRAVVYAKSSITNNLGSTSHSDHNKSISPSNSMISIGTTTNTTSPVSNIDSNVKSLSYKDFTSSQEIEENQHQHQINNPLNQSSPTGSDKQPSNTISDLISALNFNNCQFESGKYLVDLILKNHDSLISKYVPSEMGGIPEPAFILSRCFLKNIYDVECGGVVTDKQLDSVEKNVNILIYFCDKVEEVVFKDPKSNCSALCYWFSNFYTLFNIMESYIQDTKDQISFSDQDKALLEKLKITLQTMIVKAHKNVVKNITDYIQPILHKSLNDTTSEIDFMDPITNYLNQIQISLSLENCSINNNLCKLLFEQLFSYINAMIFNEILLRKDLCCLRSSIPIKMNISELEHWVKSHHSKEWSNSVCDKLKLLKEVVYILMIDKTQLENEQLRNEICPTLSIAQLKQLLTMYSPDVDSFEDPIPLELLTTLMNCPNYNPDENILLDLSKIFTLKFINSNQTLASSSFSLTDLMANINLNALESVQYSCDDLVCNVVKKNIEIVSSLSNSQKIKKI